MKDLIDRQAAIDAINSVLVEDESCKVWFKLAVKNLPSAQPEKRTETHACDLIDRQAAIDAVKDRYYKYDRFAKVEELVWEIEGLPPEQPERKRGKWIDYVNSHCECSVCHTEWSYFQNETECFEFCPNCGADMREVDDERPD